MDTVYFISLSRKYSSALRAEGRVDGLSLGKGGSHRNYRNEDNQSPVDRLSSRREIVKKRYNSRNGMLLNVPPRSLRPKDECAGKATSRIHSVTSLGDQRKYSTFSNPPSSFAYSIKPASAAAKTLQRPLMALHEVRASSLLTSSYSS